MLWNWRIYLTYQELYVPQQYCACDVLIQCSSRGDMAGQIGVDIPPFSPVRSTARALSLSLPCLSILYDATFDPIQLQERSPFSLIGHIDGL